MFPRLIPVLAVTFLPLHPANAQQREGDLTELPLEELLHVEVTLVSKRPELLHEAPGAIHVITDEDIRRSGARTLPELLRQAPGVQVARQGSHSWGVSARGFNDTFANKLLVMIDGRTIYTPLFSGVFWDMQHTLIEDIERIEVVRGPGATLWGANAVNGVINIITRHARDTQGSLLTVGGGDVEQGFGAFRHGDRFNDDTYFRVYGQFFDRDSFPAIDFSTDDSWQVAQGGFRIDWEPTRVNHLTVQGDVYDGVIREAYFRLHPSDPNPPPGQLYLPVLDQASNSVRGVNVLGRLQNSAGARSEWTYQTYYDETMRETTILDERRRTFDMDFQQTIETTDHNRLTWGAGYRLTGDSTSGTFDAALDPAERVDHLANFFIQDEFSMRDDLVVTAGTKVEHNDYTGVEVQPGVRASWTPRERHTLWGSVARAVRTPSRAEHDIRLNHFLHPDEAAARGDPLAGTEPTVDSIFGSENFGSEELIAWETGYRSQPHDRLSVDVALFYNLYDQLRSLEPIGVRADPEPRHHGVEAANLLYGETYGVELAAGWQASDFLHLWGSYSLLSMNLRAREPSADEISAAQTEGSSPRHQWQVRSSVDLPRDWEWDTALRFVDRLPAHDVSRYVEMNMRLAWTPDWGPEISLLGENLLKSAHQEFGPSLIATVPREVPRSYYGKLTWRF